MVGKQFAGRSKNGRPGKFLEANGKLERDHENGDLSSK
jgi:hypothetical protein